MAGVKGQNAEIRVQLQDLVTSPYGRPFDTMIGVLDRVLSEMIGYAESSLDPQDWQTLKHHAEDMQGAAGKVMSLYRSWLIDIGGEDSDDAEEDRRELRELIIDLIGSIESLNDKDLDYPSEEAAVEVEEPAGKFQLSVMTFKQLAELIKYVYGLPGLRGLGSGERSSPTVVDLVDRLESIDATIDLTHREAGAIFGYSGDRIIKEGPPLEFTYRGDFPFEVKKGDIVTVYRNGQITIRPEVVTGEPAKEKAAEFKAAFTFGGPTSLWSGGRGPDATIKNNKGWGDLADYVKTVCESGRIRGGFGGKVSDLLAYAEREGSPVHGLLTALLGANERLSGSLRLGDFWDALRGGRYICPDSVNTPNPQNIPAAADYASPPRSGADPKPAPDATVDRPNA